MIITLNIEYLGNQLRNEGTNSLLSKNSTQSILAHISCKEIKRVKPSLIISSNWAYTQMVIQVVLVMAKWLLLMSCAPT